MLFNSFQFAVFFVVVYGLYLALGHKRQNRMLLAASYVFYGAWDWRFLSLIFLTTVVDYLCGLGICRYDKDAKKRKVLLLVSVCSNLAILGFFKYFNFFVSSLQRFFSQFGITFQPHLLNIILPVGISFYTFQTMSYVIDIYRRELEPTQKFLDFALFVSFFPQLVAGPIERAKHLLPQVLYPRRLTLEGFYAGCYLIFWGLFMKVFVADNLAKIVDGVFSLPAPYEGAGVLIALYAFAFQIFCDFAGYSNIAIGLGKCMGFDIMVNFNLPYFSTNPREFWKRWHISLSTWLRDYVYKTFGGNRGGRLRTYRNLAITMFLGGLWHGAAWTFVFWGIYHGTLLILHRMFEPLMAGISPPKNIFFRRFLFLSRIVIFFHFICLGWLIFRARSLAQAGSMLRGLVFNFNPTHLGGMRAVVFYTWVVIAVQLFQFLKDDLLIILKTNVMARAAFYFVCFYLIMIYGVSGGREFVYFQF